MAFPKPEPGLVIRYAYLWHEEAGKGYEEGTKDRPCVIIVSTEEAEGETLVRVAPITHGPPIEAAEAVEIPELTKERLGLDDARSWVVVMVPGRPGAAKKCPPEVSTSVPQEIHVAICDICPLTLAPILWHGNERKGKERKGL